jgi:hypothetical protein
MDAQPGAPGDNTTLTDVLAHYEHAGFTGGFEIESDALRCEACGTTSPPGEFEMHSLRRLEGASDPDDMLAVVAITCPACATPGVVVLKFGPEATRAESDVLGAFRDRRGDGMAPPGAAPGETSDGGRER